MCTPVGFCINSQKGRDSCGQLSDFKYRLFCCESCTFFFWAATKKGLSPIVKQIKYVKGVSCVDQLSSVQPVTSIPTVTQNLPVGASFGKHGQS